MCVKKLIRRVILTVPGIGVLTLVGLVALIRFSPEEIPSLAKYPAVRAEWNPDLVSHFPTEMPASASLKKVSYHPGFIQGGAHIQLRLRLPTDEVRELYGKFAAKRTKSFFGGDTNRHMNEKEGMPTTFFYTGDKDEHLFPEDFEIMIFDKVVSDSVTWNKGTSHGVAISTNRSEIVYWAESW